MKDNTKAILAAAGIAGVGLYAMTLMEGTGGFGGGGGGLALPPILGGATAPGSDSTGTPTKTGDGAGDIIKIFFGDEDTAKKQSAAPTAGETSFWDERVGAFPTMDEIFHPSDAHVGFKKSVSGHAGGDIQSYAASIFGKHATPRTAASTKSDMFATMREANKRANIPKKSVVGGGYSRVYGGGRAGWQQMGYKKPTRPGQPDRY